MVLLGWLLRLQVGIGDGGVRRLRPVHLAGRVAVVQLVERLHEAPRVQLLLFSHGTWEQHRRRGRGQAAVLVLHDDAFQLGRGQLEHVQVGRGQHRWLGQFALLEGGHAVQVERQGALQTVHLLLFWLERRRLLVVEIVLRFDCRRRRVVAHGCGHCGVAEIAMVTGAAVDVALRNGRITPCRSVDDLTTTELILQQPLCFYLTDSCALFLAHDVSFWPAHWLAMTTVFLGKRDVTLGSPLIGCVEREVVWVDSFGRMNI